MGCILCSTGALLKRGGDYRALNDLSDKLLFDGLEFMMGRQYYSEADALKEYLSGSGLFIPVFHCEKSIGENITAGEFSDAYKKFEINCGIARNAGAEKMVFHLWNGLISDSNFRNNIKAYPYLNEIAEKYGIELLIENVVCNFSDPMTHFRELREEYPDIKFIFDTKMAAFHGQLELLYTKEYEWLWKEGHIRHYHINDYSGGYKDWEHLRIPPLDTGRIDFGQFFEHINKISYDGHFTVESPAHDDSGSVDTDMLNGEFEYIRKQIKKIAAGASPVPAALSPKKIL